MAPLSEANEKENAPPNDRSAGRHGPAGALGARVAGAGSVAGCRAFSYPKKLGFPEKIVLSARLSKIQHARRFDQARVFCGNLNELSAGASATSADYLVLSDLDAAVLAAVKKITGQPAPWILPSISNAYHVATQLVRQFHRAAKARDVAEADGDDRVERVQSARIEALREKVSFHPVGSPEAALYFAQRLRGDIDQMGDDESDYETEQRLDRMERLAVGLVQYLERTNGIDRAEFRLNWYGGGECDARAFGALAPVFAA